MREEHQLQEFGMPFLSLYKESVAHQTLNEARQSIPVFLHGHLRSATTRTTRTKAVYKNVSQGYN